MHAHQSQEEGSAVVVIKPVLLQAEGLTKIYSGVTALDGVSLTMRAGSVHALVGENGAGKSTFIKILAGAVHPDGGQVLINGTARQFRSPLDSRAAGIAVVHQHTHLVPDLSIAENYGLRQGFPRTAVRTVAWGELREMARKAVLPLLPGLDVSRDARSLTGVQKQLVELSFGLAAEPRVLVLDEPTAVLPHAETEALFKLVHEFVERGGAVLFVSHRLNEVFELSDQVTVLRDGKLVWSRLTADVDQDTLIKGMVGRQVTFQRDNTLQPGSEAELVVDSLTDSEGAFTDCSLKLHRGEIYGVYGLVGAGQSELCAALLGLRKTSAGSVRLGEQPDFQSLTAGERVRRGLAYVPVDRLERGVFHQMSVGENLAMASMRKLLKGKLISRKRESLLNHESIRSLLIKTTGPDQNILHLSGGNQQKVMLGRWLRTNPRVLILEEPTQGVDVGAKVEIHNQVRELARSGVAVLLVSSEMPEVLSLAHRVGIMREGKLVAELDGASATDDEILRLALPEQEKTSRGTEGSGHRRSLAATVAGQREIGLLAFLVAVLGWAAISVPGFATEENMRDILVNQSILLVGALGVATVIIAGGIDISIGAILALAAFAAGKADQAGYPALAVALLPLAVGIALGVLNGTITVLGRVHSIVVTLGMLFFLRGLLLHLMGNKWLFNLSPTVTQFGQSVVFGVPILLLVAAIAAVGMHIILRHSVPGRKLYAIGGHRPSAELLGVNGRRSIPFAFGISGFLLGVAGLLYAGRFGNLQSNAGQGFELKAIAAAVVGGTHIMGGRGTVLGVVLGTIFFGVVSNILVLKHVSSFWDNVVVGGMILLAISADTWATHSKEKSAA